MMRRFGRLTVAVVPPVPDYADTGPWQAAVANHPYLRCFACGGRLWWGDTTSGAELFVCRHCKSACDLRRVP